MQRYKILHRTYYNFASPVRLGPHALLLRPREDHELRVESAFLSTTPSATVRWHRDVEDNSVAIATFEGTTSQLSIESNVVVQQYNQVPLDFLVADYAIDYPFAYTPEDEAVLAPYMRIGPAGGAAGERGPVDEWALAVWHPGHRIQTAALLQRLASQIQQLISYKRREEPGVQAPEATLSHGTGSCRDSAFLFMRVARGWGLAARFVSGYLCSAPSAADFGATHAWAEVFLPGAGWKGFDPTLGAIVGADHIAVAVSRLPESVPPVAGSFTGPPGAGSFDVGVWVTPLS
jgi:transglutaminase-like putative cysteine protease